MRLLNDMRKIFLIGLLISAPSYGAENYACFDRGQGASSLQSLRIDGSTVEWADNNWSNNMMSWERAEKTFPKSRRAARCDLAYAYNETSTGFFVNLCWHQADTTLKSVKGFFELSDPYPLIEAKTYDCMELK